MPGQARLTKLRETDRLIAAIVVASAVASAMLVLRVTDAKIIAGAFGAAGLLIAALMLAFRHLHPPEVKVDSGVDWSLVRTAADQDNVALAITDRSGRLVCANPAHEVLFGSSATPPGSSRTRALMLCVSAPPPRPLSATVAARTLMPA